jgi:hypothetical protein
MTVAATTIAHQTYSMLTLRHARAGRAQTSDDAAGRWRDLDTAAWKGETVLSPALHRRMNPCNAD